MQYFGKEKRYHKIINGFELQGLERHSWGQDNQREKNVSGSGGYTVAL